MFYQIEIFEEEDLKEMQDSLNKFLLLLEAEAIKEIIYDEKMISKSSGEVYKLYTAMVIYIYKAEE